MKNAVTVFLMLLTGLTGGAFFLQAQDHTGIIQGTVTDSAGRPLVGAAVYLSSPAMLGMQILSTGKAGRFDFSGLPTGVYVLTVEMPGYQTLVRDKIVLHTGMSFGFHFNLGPSDQDVDVPASIPPSALDQLSAKTTAVTDQAMLRNLPLARNFGDILNLAPEVLGSGFPFNQDASIAGGTVRDNVYALDGVNLSDMVTQSPVLNLHPEIMEEIEFISAGKPASQLPAGGAYVNVVSKSGGNDLAGDIGLFVMSAGLNKDLWTPAQIKDLGTGPVSGDKNQFEGSLNVGGPFWADRAWFFLAGRYSNKSLADNFLGPYRDLLGRQHNPYDWSRKDQSGFFKLVVSPMTQAKFAAWVNLSDGYQPILEDPSPRLPFISTKILGNDTIFALHGSLDYAFNPDFLANIRGGFVSRTTPSRLQADALNMPWIDDAGDLYGPLSGGDYNSDLKKQRIQAEASIRLMADQVLGVSHALVAGVDFDDSTSSLDWWRWDNFLSFLDSRNPGNLYYADRGLIGFWNCGTGQTSTVLSGRSEHLGIFLTDSFTVAKRLTFNVGLRFDRSWGWFPSGSKSTSGNPLSVFIGDALVGPYLKSRHPGDFPQAFNPWGGYATPEQTGLISWNALSPRAGFAFDLWGNGRTIFKASYGRYADELSHRYFLPLNPLYPRSFSLYWLDANGDGRPDEQDEYSLPSEDYRYLSGGFNANRVADSISAPTTEEISFGLDHELFKDFTLGLHVVSKQQNNILEDVLYAPDTGEYWYSLDQAAAQKYWIPFTTTVPGTGSFPDATATFYAKSAQAPQIFLQLRNVPELMRKYQALEFFFQKRMARGWQMAGSLVLSKTQGNIGGFADATSGFSAAGNSPNYFLNRDGRLDTDRPVQLRLMGSVELPLRFRLSAFFQYQSGGPWQRTALILPSAAWSLVRNVERMYYAVNLEASGSRREKDRSTLDVRLEKEWRLGDSARLGLYADITNLLSSTESLVGLNDVDRWLPAAEGAGQPGVKFLQPDYQVMSALFGKRTLRFGFRLSF